MTGQHSAEGGIALTIGAFDGLHRGHQDLIARMVTSAARSGRTSVCMTFDPDPEVVLHPEREHRSLSTADERRAQMLALGVGRVEVVPFTRELSQQTPATFVGWIRAAHDLRELWVGPDFALGHNRTGGIEALRAIGAACGFQVIAVEPYLHQGQPVNSSWIRKALAAGDVELAAELLGRPYCVAGPVIAGMRRGRELGFPTANVVPPPGRACPGDGVYVAAIRVPDGATWSAVLNLGARPTFDEAERLLEAHLLDFSGDLYGAHLEIHFLHRLRGIRRFGGLEELREQIARDVQAARELARQL